MGHNGTVKARATRARKAFYAAKEEIEKHLVENEAIFDAARLMGDRHNATLDTYKQALRDLLIEEGEDRIFDGTDDEFLVSATKKKAFDHKPLLAELDIGELQDAQAVKVTKTFTVREKECAELLAAGKISQKVYEAACKKIPGTPSVRSPYGEYRF